MMESSYVFSKPDYVMSFIKEVKWRRALFKDPTEEHHSTVVGNSTLYILEHCVVACSEPDYTFDYPRAKYFSSAKFREIWHLKPILCNSISQEFSKEEVTLSG
jgi:hypothetical protein